MVPSAAGGLAGGALLARRRPRGPFVRNPCDNSRSGAILTPEGASRTESRLKPTSRRRFLAREKFFSALVGASPIRAESAVRRHPRVIL